MNNNNNSATSGGIGVTGLLQVAFIVLKLCEIINWSWWWVLAPTWVGLALVLLMIVAIIIVALTKK